jgi:hypothetical protein
MKKMIISEKSYNMCIAKDCNERATSFIPVEIQNIETILTYCSYHCELYKKNKYEEMIANLPEESLDPLEDLDKINNEDFNEEDEEQENEDLL